MHLIVTHCTYRAAILKLKVHGLAREQARGQLRTPSKSVGGVRTQFVVRLSHDKTQRN